MSRRRSLRGRRNSRRFARSANKTKLVNVRRPLYRGGLRF